MITKVTETGGKEMDEQSYAAPLSDHFHLQINYSVSSSSLRLLIFSSQNNSAGFIAVPVSSPGDGPILPAVI
jgi:hypothetical protein